MNLFRRNLKQVRKSLQKGFTLIELAIVAIFLGLLAVFAITTFSSTGTSTTRANALWDSAGKLADNWALIAQTCGTSSDVTATAVGGGAASTTAAKNLDLLVGNAAPVAGAMTTCFNNSGVRALTGLTTGGSGAEQVQGYTMSVSNVTTSSGKNALAVTLAGVPDSVILPLYNKYSSVSTAASASALATSDSTDPTIQYTAVAAGVRSLTLIRPL